MEEETVDGKIMNNMKGSEVGESDNVFKLSLYKRGKEGWKGRREERKGSVKYKFVE